jgi:glycosyltransferase involved in cell wall biosynthesis
VKLIIQIPCFNEEESLPVTLAALPRSLPGFATVEWMVIDDGSIDNTVEVARANGVDHIVRLPTHQGLARAFMAGIEAALRAGADVIVNTDADNQYRAADIPALIAPIREGRAEIVIGARPIAAIADFSASKRLMQRLGSWAVRRASGTDIPDAPSGFRAFHRTAAAHIYVHDTFTHTLDTIIQAGRKNIPISWVKVDVNPPLRPSRLFRSVLGYVRRSAFTIIRIFVIYKPLRFFTFLAVVVALPGLYGFLRFLYFFFTGSGAGHIQSLVVSAGLLGMAMVLQMGGLLADIVAANRRLLEDIRARQLLAEIEREGRGADEQPSK